MVNGRPILVKMFDELIPAMEYDIAVKVVGGTAKDFYKVWDIETQKRLLNSAIEHEDYENAQIIKEVMADTGSG